MALINEMVIDANGGVCLKINLKYYTYTKSITGCTCNDIIEGQISENIANGVYVKLHKNINSNYIIDIKNDAICLKTDSYDISMWFEFYLEELSKNTYNGYNGSKIENRVIYPAPFTDYYRIEHTQGVTCNVDTKSRMAIVKYNDPDIIWDGSGDYFHTEQDECGMPTGIRKIKMKDINPSSPSYGQIQVIDKCLIETEPVLKTNSAKSISNKSAILSGEVLYDGGYPIIEKGFCYSLNKYPSINDNTIKIDVDQINFESVVSGLKSDSYYYFKSYARNIIGLSYGNSTIFKTNS